MSDPKEKKSASSKTPAKSPTKKIALKSTKKAASAEDSKPKKKTKTAPSTQEAVVPKVKKAAKKKEEALLPPKVSVDAPPSVKSALSKPPSPVLPKTSASVSPSPAVKPGPISSPSASEALKPTPLKPASPSGAPHSPSVPATHKSAQFPPTAKPASNPTPAARPPAKPGTPPSKSPAPANLRPASPSPSPDRPVAPSEKKEIKAEVPAPVAPRTKIQVNEMVTVKELSEKMNVKLPDVIKKLISMGVMANMNQRLNPDAARLLTESFGFDLEVVPLYAEESINVADDPKQMVARPPVVTVMGHVDHGKTSLLDAIRQARVAEKEAGGITQHIGAYQVKTEKGVVTFLDTPGHEAFTAMRARGAQVTDLVVLVVAADDGVMPQTIEALDHAKAAGVPIVVAINKCDLPTANAQRIKQELSTHGLQPEDWGGKTVMVEVSARQKTNLDKLLEMILLEAELLELKANPLRRAQGVVVEARLDSRRGPVATVLVQKGTLRVGDAFVCGVTAGKIRALTDYRGEKVKDAGPAYPVEILGLSGTPQTGDKLVVVGTEKEAREIADRRQAIASDEAKAHKQHLTLEAFHKEAVAGKVKSLPIVLKADVQGSLEAIRDSLERINSEEISLRLIHLGTGGVNTSDVVLADASDAIILGFNVRPDPLSEELARRDGVEIKTYRIIYDLINDVKAALEGLLEPEEKDVTLGWAEVRQVFRAPKIGAVAGLMVTEGKISRAGKVRLIRNGAIVFDGPVASLRRFKDDVRDVEKGFECGLSLGNFQDVKTGDRVEAYTVEKQARKLS